MCVPATSRINRAEKHTGADKQRLLQVRGYFQALRLYSASSQQKCLFPVFVSIDLIMWWISFSNAQTLPDSLEDFGAMSILYLLTYLLINDLVWCRPSLFGHISRTDVSADAKTILLASPPGLEKRTRTSPHHVAEHRPTGSETPQPLKLS